jgi:hypothetical protein
VTLTFDNSANVTAHTFRFNAVNGDVNTSVGLRTGTVDVPAGKVVKETVKYTEDEFDGVGALTVQAIAGPNTALQTPLDIYPVDTDCLPPIVVPTTTVPVPAPTTTASVAPTAPLTTVLRAPDPTVVIDRIVVNNPTQFRTIPVTSRGVQTG